MFFGLNKVSKRFFTDEEKAGFESIKHKSNIFLNENKGNTAVKDMSMFNTAEETNEKTNEDETHSLETTVQSSTTNANEEETQPLHQLTSQHETQKFRTIGDLKSIFNDPSSPPPLPKEIIKRLASSSETLHEPVHELGGFLTFSPDGQANLNAKTNSRVFENNLKVTKDNSGENRRTRPEPLYATIDTGFRTAETLTHAEVLSISQRMSKRGKGHDIVTDIISDSSSNPSPRSPTGREVKSILLKNRKNSPKKVKFSNKVKVGTAYHVEEEVLFSEDPTHIGDTANSSTKGLLLQSSPAFTTQNRDDDIKKPNSKQRYYIEDNTEDNEFIGIRSKLNDSSEAMRHAAESLGIGFVGKDSSAFIKITNLDG